MSVFCKIITDFQDFNPHTNGKPLELLSQYWVFFIIKYILLNEMFEGDKNSKEQETIFYKMYFLLDLYLKKMWYSCISHWHDQSTKEKEAAYPKRPRKISLISQAQKCNRVNEILPRTNGLHGLFSWYDCCRQSSDLVKVQYLSHIFKNILYFQKDYSTNHALFAHK